MKIENELWNLPKRIESPKIVGSFASQKWIDLETFRPLTIIIDKNGIIREYMFGKKSYNSFKLVIDKYLWLAQQQKRGYDEVAKTA